MSDVIIPYRFLWRGGTASALTTTDEVVRAREAEVETDTSRFKIGDGTTAWSSLKYANLGAVDFTGLSNGRVPTWDAATSTFKMVAPSGGGSGGGRAYTDPAFSDVATLLHCDGTNGSTTITDQVAGNTWTATSATISTTQSVFGGASVKFTGASNSSISCPTSSKFDVGSGDFSLECRIYPAGTHQTSSRIFQSRDGDVTSGLSVIFGTGNAILLYLSSNGTSYNVLSAAAIGTLVANAFNSFILQRTGSLIECFLNGNRTYSGTITAGSSLYYNASDKIIVGGNATGISRSINAYVDEIRFTKGLAVVGTEVDVPSSAFADS